MNAKKRIIIVLSIPFGTALIVLLAVACGVRFNIMSNSLPPGLYRIVGTGKGSDLLICPMGTAQTLSIERGYRPKSFGCADGYAPFLKPIAARAGDVVTVSERGIAVNGKLLPNTRAFPIDGRGRTLPNVAYGSYTVQPGTVWIVSSYNRYSFDSRYFGPVALQGKVRYATPLWLF